MQLTMSDRIFLEHLNLAPARFRSVREKFARKKYTPAALEAAEVIFSTPIPHALPEAEIPLVAKGILAEKPETVSDLIQRIPTMLKQRQKIQAAATLCARLGQLYALTGKKIWLTKAVEQIWWLAKTAPHLSDDPLPAMLMWHPGKEKYDEVHLNYIVYELSLALPFLRPHLAPKDALQYMKNLMALGEYCYRGTQNDVMFNHPLGYVIAACTVGCYFPDFKAASLWRTWACDRLSRDCTGDPTITEDGYFREGLAGYQEINAKHMVRCLKALRASGNRIDPKVYAITENAFDFMARIVRMDGFLPMVGDGGMGDLLHATTPHIASAFFRRADFKTMNPVPPSTGCEIQLRWEMGATDYQWWKEQAYPNLPTRPQLPVDFRRSGFQVMGCGYGRTAHHGLLVYGISTNHAHYDVGSIDISGFGRPLLTDPGKGTYAAPQYSTEIVDRAHNLPCLVRRTAFGPRIDNRDYAKTVFVQHKKEFQAAGMVHTLYENHAVSRSLVCIPVPEKGSKTKRATPQTDDVIWLVIDRIKRLEKWPRGATVPLELIETFFHFNAPETELGIDEDRLTCWSRYQTGRKTLPRYDMLDTNLAGTPADIDLPTFLRAGFFPDSDANLQVTAVIPEEKNKRTAMEAIASSTVAYGGRVKRPAMKYHFRGKLPFTAAYVLLPFVGLREKPFAQISGGWSSASALDLGVRFKDRNVIITATRVHAKSPTFTVRCR